jgi:serine/threonine-protein kinase HipA
MMQGSQLDRLGLESLASLVGVTDFAVSVSKETLALAISRYTTDPHSELREFVARDVLDVAMGNTDNHARNTSVLKGTDGTIALSPLYDFAPMVLDRRGIARVSRWQDGSDYPDWTLVAKTLEQLGLDSRSTRQWLRGLSERVSHLPETMRGAGVPDQVVGACLQRIPRVADGLAQVTS